LTLPEVILLDQISQENWSPWSPLKNLVSPNVYSKQKLIYMQHVYSLARQCDVFYAMLPARLWKESLIE